MNRKLSDLRKELNQTQEQIQQLLDGFHARSPMLPGALYQLKRKCGKENCRCAQGQLHVSTVLSYRGPTKTQTITPAPEHLATLKQMTDDYRQHRQRRAQLVKLQKQALRLVDQIQELRVQQGERELQKMRSDSSRS
jgi:hypothetical protein